MDDEKLYTVYADETGRGDGSFLGGFDAVEDAREFAKQHWSPESGWSLYKGDKLIATCKPTHPEEREPYNDDPYNETGRY